MNRNHVLIIGGALTLSSSHHEALANAELDLQALTRAVKLLEQSAL